MEQLAGLQGRVRCPDCGGLNPPAAQWCGVCLTRFAPPAPPPPPAAPLGSTAPGPASPSQPASRPAPVSPDGGAGFKVTQQGITWTCRVCESTNVLAAASCSVCGAGIAMTLREPEAEGPERDPGTAALLSMILPGVGHAYLKMWPEAIARGVISAWVVLVTVFATMSGRGGMMTFLAVLFGTTAFGLWVVASHDAYRVADKQPDLVLLSGRYFLYLVLGLLFLLFVCLSVSAMALKAS